MTKLSNAQIVILSAAAQRPEHIAIPLPTSLRGGAASKVVSAMLANGFLHEVDADVRNGEPIWRETGDGHGVTLVATDAGLAAIGIDPDGGDSAPTGADEAPTADGPGDTPSQRPDEGVSDVPAETAPAAPEPAATRAPPRDGSKIATVLALLRQQGGTTIADISAATCWQSHTVRGALAGAVGRRMGLKVISHKEKGEARRYRLAD